MTSKPRRGLTALQHARPMPIADTPDLPQFETQARPGDTPPDAAAPQLAPAPAAATAEPPPAPRPEPEDPTGRVRVRKKDNAKLVRKSWRIREHVADALAAYCEAERWSEGTVAERALEAYLESVGYPAQPEGE